MGADRHEVIVVGAGPAGSVAASVLAQAGRDVLLLDQTGFPRDKACGDMIPWQVVRLMLDLGMGEAVRAAQFYPIKATRIVSPSGTVFETRVYDHDGTDTCIVPREVFDAILWEHACKRGAQFEVVHVEAPIVEKGRVVGVSGRTGSKHGAWREIRAALVIAADGATSAIARALRRHKPPYAHRAVALRAYIDDFDVVDHMAESYFTRDLVPGYGWVFPIGEGCANVGVGMRLDLFRQRGRTLKEMLDDFLRLPTIARRRGAHSRVDKVLVWQLHFGSDGFPQDIRWCAACRRCRGVHRPADRGRHLRRDGVGEAGRRGRLAGPGRGRDTPGGAGFV